MTREQIKQTIAALPAIDPKTGRPPMAYKGTLIELQDGAKRWEEVWHIQHLPAIEMAYSLPRVLRVELRDTEYLGRDGDPWMIILIVQLPDPGGELIRPKVIRSDDEIAAEMARIDAVRCTSMEQVDEKNGMLSVLENRWDFGTVDGQRIDGPVDLSQRWQGKAGVPSHVHAAMERAAEWLWGKGE